MVIIVCDIFPVHMVWRYSSFFLSFFVILSANSGLKYRVPVQVQLWFQQGNSAHYFHLLVEWVCINADGLNCLDTIWSCQVYIYVQVVCIHSFIQDDFILLFYYTCKTVKKKMKNENTVDIVTIIHNTKGGWNFYFWSALNLVPECSCFEYAVQVRRHTPWSRGPLSWIPGMWFTLCQFRVSISFAMAQSSHNSEIYNIGVHAQ